MSLHSRQRPVRALPAGRACSSSPQPPTLQLHHSGTAPVQRVRKGRQTTAWPGFESVRVEECRHSLHTVCELVASLSGGAAREAVVKAIANVADGRFAQACCCFQFSDLKVGIQFSDLVVLPSTPAAPATDRRSLWRVSGYSWLSSTLLTPCRLGGLS